MRSTISYWYTYSSDLWLKFRTRLRSVGGFSIVELIVSVSVIAIISTLLIANFRVGKDRDELRGAANVLAAVLQQAQAYALAGRTASDSAHGTLVPPGGYGVYISVPANQIMFFGDDGDHLFDSTKDYAIEAIPLSSRVSIDGPGTCIDPDSQSGCVAASSLTLVTAIPSGDHYLNSVVNKGALIVKFRHSNLSNQSVSVSASAISGQISTSGIASF